MLGLWLVENVPCISKPLLLQNVGVNTGHLWVEEPL